MRTIIALLAIFGYLALAALAGLLVYGAHHGQEALAPEKEDET